MKFLVINNYTNLIKHGLNNIYGYFFTAISNRITAQNVFFKLRKIDNRNKWNNYVIVTRVKLSLELNELAIRDQPLFIQL